MSLCTSWRSAVSGPQGRARRCLRTACKKRPAGAGPKFAVGRSSVGVDRRLDQKTAQQWVCSFASVAPASLLDDALGLAGVGRGVRGECGRQVGANVSPSRGVAARQAKKARLSGPGGSFTAPASRAATPGAQAARAAPADVSSCNLSEILHISLANRVRSA